MPKHFYCINKGILVNLNYVKRIEQDDVILTYLKQTVTLPIARNKKKILKTHFSSISDDWKMNKCR